MRTKSLIFSIFTILLFALGLLITVIFNMTPDTTTVLVMFYASLFFSVFGLIFFTFYLVQYKQSETLPPWSRTVAALRWAFLTSLTAVIILMLKSVDLLNAATLAIIIVATFTGEVLLRRKFTWND